MQHIAILFLTLTLLFLSACSTRGYKVYQQQKKHPLTPIDTNQSAHANEDYKSKILYTQYEKWKGVAYTLGGESLNGIDCSSFIQQVYYDGFGLKVPRTTLSQLQVGYEIQKKELQVGDMIFFKTDWNVRHVGIIIKDGSFVHASTSKGVTISSIYNPYWRDKYYKSRRILP